MNIDLHLHTTYSYQGEIGHKLSDSILDMQELPKLCAARGLDGIVITDHMTCEAGNQALQKIRDEHPNILFLRGMEYHSNKGHLLVFGITNDDVCRKFGKYGPAQEVIDYVGELGGICIPSHPYVQGYTHTLGDGVYELRGIAAVEAINGQLGLSENSLAQVAAAQLQLPGTGGSDAHDNAAVGKVYTKFDVDIRSMEDLIAAIRHKQCKAARVLLPQS